MMHALGAEELSSTGSAAAFERAAEPLMPSLRVYCRSVARDRWDADDLFQETLEKAFVRFARTGGAPITKAYLCRIASNAWIDRLRRAREFARPAEWAGWETLARDECDGADDARAAIERLLASLTPKQRTALLLYEAFGLSLQETADRLGLTVGSVKSLLHRARARLQRTDDADGEELSAPDASAADAYLHALRHGLTDAVVALGEAADAGPTARLARRGAVRTAGRARGAAGIAGFAGFAATADGAVAAVVAPRGGAPARVMSFRAGDAIAA